MLYDIYKMDYSKCYNTYDLITLDEWEETLPTVKIRFIDSSDTPPRITCYDSRSLNRWILQEENIFAKWIPADEDKDMDSMGYGGVPDILYRYIKLYTNEYIIIDSNLEKLYALMQDGLIIVDAIFINRIRIGNTRGEFGIGDLHGQEPGERVYQIIGHMYTPNIYNNTNFSHFFRQFGIFSIEDLYSRLKSIKKQWKTIAKLDMPQLEVLLKAKLHDKDKYILNIHMKDKDKEEKKDIIIFKIDKDHIYDIIMLDVLHDYNDHDNDDNFNITPRQLFVSETPYVSHDLDDILYKYDIHSLNEFITKFIEIEPIYQTLNNTTLIAIISKSDNEEVHIEKTNDIYSIIRTIFKEDSVESNILAKFRYNSVTRDIYNIVLNA